MQSHGSFKPYCVDCAAKDRDLYDKNQEIYALRGQLDAATFQLQSRSPASLISSHTGNTKQCVSPTPMFGTTRAKTPRRNSTLTPPNNRNNVLLPSPPPPTSVVTPPPNHFTTIPYSNFSTPASSRGVSPIGGPIQRPLHDDGDILPYAPNLYPPLPAGRVSASPSLPMKRKSILHLHPDSISPPPTTTTPTRTSDPLLFSKKWLEANGLVRPVKELVWCSDVQQTGNKRPQKTIRTRGKDVQNVLYSMLSGDKELLDEITNILVNDSDFEERVKQEVEKRENSERFQQLVETRASQLEICTTIERQIVDSLVEWIALHTAEGSRKTDVYNALVAIGSAVFYRNNLSHETILEHLGLGRKIGQTARAVNRETVDRGKPYKNPSRKTRKDNFFYRNMQIVREHFCHNDEFARIESFSNMKHVKMPITRKMESGGYELIEWKYEEHCVREYDGAVTVDDLYDRFKNLAAWKSYVESEGGRPKVSRTQFSQLLCPCCRPPQEKSCANTFISGQEYLQKALRGVLRDDPQLSKLKIECQCPRHKQYRQAIQNAQEPPILLEDHLFKHPRKFLDMITCPRQPHAHLKLPDESETPSMTPWDCGMSNCQECGAQKTFGFEDCTTLTNATRLIDVKVWGEGARGKKNRGGGSDKKRTQKEILSKTLPFNTVLDLLHENTTKSLRHVTEDQWGKRAQKLCIHSCPKRGLVVETDFSATPFLEARYLENSSEAAHCVLAIYVCLYNFRVAKIKYEGLEVEILVNSCQDIAMIGPSDGVGKQNDHRFHTACLDGIVDHFKNRIFPDLELQLQVVFMKTDNCGGQYKSQANMWEAAAFAKKHPGVILMHSFAIIHEFKGSHDNAGKVVKNNGQKGELKEEARMNAALNYFEYQHKTLHSDRHKWKQYEVDCDERLLDKGIYSADFFRIGYCTEDRAEYEQVKRDYPDNPLVFLCDRESPASVVGKEAAKGIHKLHFMRGFLEPSSTMPDGTEMWKLEVADHPCFCIKCRDDETRHQCTTLQIRNVRTLEVRDVSNEALPRMERFIRNKLGWKQSQSMTCEKLKAELQKANAFSDDIWGEKVTGRRMRLIKTLCQTLRDPASAKDMQALAGLNLNLSVVLADEDSDNGCDDEQEDVQGENDDDHMRLVDNGLSNTTGEREGGEKELDCGCTVYTIYTNRELRIMDLNSLNYRELQANLKSRDLPRRGSQAILKERLEKHLEQQEA